MEHAILQYGCDDIDSNFSATTNVPLVITKELANNIVNYLFCSGDLEHIDEGLHAFCTIYISTAKAS